MKLSNILSNIFSIDIDQVSIATDIVIVYHPALVQRILQQLPAIIHVLSPDRKTRHLNPTWQDIEVLEAINNSLSPLTGFTDALSAEQYASLLCEAGSPPF